MEIKFPPVDVKVKITVCCPTCGNHEIPPEHLRGILINRKLSLGSEIVMVKNQISQLNSKKENAQRIQLQKRLEKLEAELAELEELQ